MLKRFCNVLYAVFSKDCPYFQCCVQIVDALRDFSRPAKKAMTKLSRASILWIMLLQSRHFAMGNTTVLAEFTSMQADLCAKRGQITHAEVPFELVAEAKKRPGDGDSGSIADEGRKRLKGGSGGGDDGVPLKKANPNTWHSKLRAKLADPLKVANYPSFSAIIKYCQASPGEIIGKRNRKCAPNTFFGRCFHKDRCLKEHFLPTDEEADKILKMVDKFIKNPEGLKTGK